MALLFEELHSFSALRGKTQHCLEDLLADFVSGVTTFSVIACSGIHKRTRWREVKATS